ncbi:MAG: hypothetical protein ACOYJ2_02755 [Rickettsiales bacterium]
MKRKNTLLFLPLAFLVSGCFPDKIEKTESEIGRYQIVLGSIARKDTYLIDTKTGRTWRQTSLTDLNGDPEVWMPLDIVDLEIDGEQNDIESLINKHKFKKQ